MRNAERGDEMQVDRYCFRAPYVAALLRDGLGLADDSGYHIEGGGVAWTLGAPHSPTYHAFFGVQPSESCLSSEH